MKRDEIFNHIGEIGDMSLHRQHLAAVCDCTTFAAVVDVQPSSRLSGGGSGSTPSPASSCSCSAMLPRILCVLVVAEVLHELQNVAREFIGRAPSPFLHAERRCIPRSSGCRHSLPAVLVAGRSTPTLRFASAFLGGFGVCLFPVLMKLAGAAAAWTRCHK